jgi:Fe-S-cluster-containing dehydrogenase component
MATLNDLKISEVKLSEEESGKWGMVIDQDICTGCQACVAACAMENNISFVGEEDAGYGRSMHWIRIERFWEGEYPEVKMTPNQPMMCQQCGSAPCEPVCPAFATVHSLAEQVNLQVYNRCVGTRYCANNCPYQVRSFNWRDYRRPEPLAQSIEPGCHRPPPRHYGKMHLLHPAHPQGTGQSEGRRTRSDGWRIHHCLRTGMPCNAPSPLVAWTTRRAGFPVGDSTRRGA